MLAGNGAVRDVGAVKEALIDSGLVFGFTFLSALAVFGFPPTLEAIYLSLISSGISFMATMAARRKIKQMPPRIGSVSNIKLSKEEEESLEAVLKIE